MQVKQKEDDEKAIAHSFKTMQVKTAAALYDVRPAYLTTLCTRRIVRGQFVGGRWFVTPGEMDRVFRGIPLEEKAPAKAKKR